MSFIIKLLSVLILAISLCSCGSNVTVSNDTTENNTTQQTTNEEKIYHIGDKITISDNEGEYNLTITGVKETDYRNEFSDVDAERVVIISYEYENVSQPEDLYISSMNFKLYDKQNNAMETYPADINSADSVGTGRKATGEEGYALNSADNYIELEYYDNLFNSKKDCKIILEW